MLCLTTISKDAMPLETETSFHASLDLRAEKPQCLNYTKLTPAERVQGLVTEHEDKASLHKSCPEAWYRELVAYKYASFAATIMLELRVCSGHPWSQYSLDQIVNLLASMRQGQCGVLGQPHTPVMGDCAVSEVGADGDLPFFTCSQAR